MMGIPDSGDTGPREGSMAKRARKASLERSDEPMPWQDFVIGYEVANQALLHLERPAVKPPFLRPEPHPGQRDPSRWISLAVARHFGRDYPHLVTFQRRFWALMQLIEGDDMSEWVSAVDDESPRRLHPALLLAAAEVRLTRNGKFPTRRFARRVAEIVRTELDEPAAGGDTQDPDGN